jgi:hypothetical protein
LFRPETVPAQEAVMALLWAAVAGALFLMLLRISTRQPGSTPTLAAWGVVAWITASATGAWMVRHVDPWQPDRAQLGLLQSSARPWLDTGFVSGRGVISPDEVLGRLRFGAPANERVLFLAPRVPAGSYRIVLGEDGAASAATFSLELGRDAWPVHRWSAGEPAPAFRLALPVHSVRVLTDTPGPTSRTVHLEVERVQRTPTGPIAQHVTRYGSLDVYALDPAPLMETGGFWIPGNRRTAVVVSDREGHAPSMALALEASEPATVRVSRGAWREDRLLQPAARTELVVPAGEPLVPLLLEVSGTSNRQAIWVAVAARPQLR